MALFYGIPLLYHKFPVEVAHLILCNLDLKTLLTCRRVRKALKGYIDERLQLQYLMELEVAGMKHNPYYPGETVDCYRSLEDYRSAWISISAEWNPEVLTIENMLGGRLWDLCGGVLAYADPGNALHFRRLPSVSRRIDTMEWRIEQGSRRKDIALDASQNLLVLLISPTRGGHSLDIHLRTLDEESVDHPFAERPVLSYLYRYPSMRENLQIQIMESHIALLVHYEQEYGEEDDDDDKTELIVWNWKAGKCKLALRTDTTRSFTFLSERQIILANLVYGSVQRDINISIINLLAERYDPTTLAEFEHAVTLLYPRPSSAFRVDEFNIFSEPLTDLLPEADHQTPFFPSAKNRIFVVTLMLFPEYGGEAVHFVHFIPLSALAPGTGNNMSSEVQQVPWSDWGPRKTCLIRSDVPNVNLWNYCHGSRYVSGRWIRENSENDFAFEIKVYDFNQLDIQWAQAKGFKRQVHRPATLPRNEPFEIEVETTLPFTVQRKLLRLPRADYGVMCGADNILVINKDAGDCIIFKF